MDSINFFPRDKNSFAFSLLFTPFLPCPWGLYLLLKNNKVRRGSGSKTNLKGIKGSCNLHSLNEAVVAYCSLEPLPDQSDNRQTTFCPTPFYMESRSQYFGENSGSIWIACCEHAEPGHKNVRVCRYDIFADMPILVVADIVDIFMGRFHISALRCLPIWFGLLFNHWIWFGFGFEDLTGFGFDLDLNTAGFAHHCCREYMRTVEFLTTCTK